MTNETSHRDTFNAGLQARKEVLGEAHVERSLAQATEFTQPMQELVTEYCWGAIWTREGLDRQTRSLLNLALLTALNRSHELAVHVRGAINNGVTKQQLQEVFLQTAIYVGVPAALESFRIAEKVIEEMDVQ
ncbi:4-carboxymuconolactone decarboxylase [Microbacterium sp. YMB-B2]|uniref:4-carboxymuconolactone decarboxylase n=1 Tax=Microbacterium tenebrionis TaxID=2830665 RepID=A0A9X1LQY5_9MICO|nr:4-carboxymuconolactone decarboxylase [Microbacterium tenebrionis]MCC2030053.1 4-carboxymuconolactone decarboxylase [Microbacterium tenebrionis]